MAWTVLLLSLLVPIGDSKSRSLVLSGNVPHRGPSSELQWPALPEGEGEITVTETFTESNQRMLIITAP